MREQLARLLRTAADRLDYEGAPKRMTTLSVALGPSGWELRQDGTGVPVWHYGDADYLRAWQLPAVADV